MHGARDVVSLFWFLPNLRRTFRLRDFLFFVRPFPHPFPSYLQSHRGASETPRKGNSLADRTDEELVRAALRGDIDGFMQLCHRYYAPMHAVALAILRDSHLSEDAVQEALAKACRSLPALKNPSRFGPWLTTICRNHAREIFRRNPRLENWGARDIAEDVCEGSADLDAMRDVIEALPPESRELLYLKYGSDLSHQQMSNLLGISLQAVHGRLKRAKQGVRERLELERNRRKS